MGYKKNTNWPEFPTGVTDWIALLNDLVNKYEAGRTIKVTAGEELNQYNAARIDSDGDAYHSDSTSEVHGLLPDDIS